MLAALLSEIGEEITDLDVLDALASAGLRLELDGNGLVADVYSALLSCPL